jgi:DNA-binding IclR family transcriptional regulator
MSEPQKVNSLIRAAEILKCLANGLDQSSVIADTIQLSRSTTHRLLKTLALTGFTTQDPITRKHYLGPLFQRLAADPLVIHQVLIQSAIPEMKRLKDTFGETVMLQVRQGAHRIIIEELKSDQLISYFWGKGMSAPIHTGASGKILLSELGDAELAILFEKIELFPFGPRTITSKKALSLELRKIRKQGYATSLSEHHEGAYAVAVPIKNYICPVSLAVAGHESRMRRKKDSIVGNLKQSASKIAGTLREEYSLS